MLVTSQPFWLSQTKTPAKVVTSGTSLETFRPSSKSSGQDAKWDIARLRQHLPTKVERTNFSDLNGLLQKHGMAEHAPKLEMAYQMAEKAHAGVKRQEGTPYIHHPARVCAILIKDCGVKDVDALTAALLHDVVEDSPITLAEVEKKFGSRTATFVDLLTKPDAARFESKEARNRFQAERLAKAPKEVRMVKIADRLDNVSDLHLLPNNGKMERYLDDTRCNYLPLAQSTDQSLFQTLNTRLEQLDRLAQLQKLAA